MTDKKLTDKEIISSLEVIATTGNCDECKIRNCKWGTCNCSQITANVALDLINRQKAEIEKLKECPKCVYEYDGEVTEYCIQGPCPNFKPVYVSADLSIKQIKNEAYKEFAERLNEGAQIADCFDSYSMVVGTYFIDNLLKEMVGEEE